MRIAYFADISSIHNFKWINYFSEGNEVIIICAKSVSTPYSSFSKPLSVKIYPILPETYPLSFFLKRLYTLYRIKKILKKHSIEVAHSMYVVSYSFWAYLAGSPNHIITTRGSDVLIEYKKLLEPTSSFRLNRINKYFKRLFKKSLDDARFITSTSHAQMDVVKTFIANTKKQHLIRTGINIDQFKSNLDGVFQEKQRSEFVVFSPRSMKPLYNIDVIIDAVTLVRKKHPHKTIKLVLVDDYPDTAYSQLIHSKISLFGSDQFCDIYFKQTSEQMIALYKNADIVVMIPNSDGTPVSAIEGMLAKKPLILGNAKYDADLFNESTVWSIQLNNSKQLADKIDELMRLDKNSIIEKTEKACEQAVTLADMTKELKKMEQLYKSCLY